MESRKKCIWKDIQADAFDLATLLRKLALFSAIFTTLFLLIYAQSKLQKEQTSQLAINKTVDANAKTFLSFKWKTKLDNGWTVSTFIQLSCIYSASFC